MSILNLNRIRLWMLRKQNRNILIKNRIIILGDFPYFKLFKGSKCIIHNNVVINSDFRKTNTALAYKCKFAMGYEGIIEIGENTHLNGVSITAYKNVKIGRDCQIASATFITDTDFHPVDPVERLKQVTKKPFNLDTVNKKEVIIGDNVWIGWGAIILKGVEIGNNSIVAAGSVVTGKFPDNVIIAGNPAKVVKCI
ncbi:MAG: DapH/DapD/GlmU-related protein [Bacillota bacterium]